MLTLVPPAAGPEMGLIELTTGADAETDTPGQLTVPTSGLEPEVVR
jgi:hypothetical protein